jgi:hypothetical protein
MRTRLCSKCQKPKTREEFRAFFWFKPWGQAIYCKICLIKSERTRKGRNADSRIQVRQTRA